MKNIILTGLNSWLKTSQKAVLLFDSTAAANEIAFMLQGEWDGCNGVIISKGDEVAINTAASLMETAWCYQGASKAVLVRLTTDELLRRYAIGERIFINANLRCAVLASLKLSEINLSYAQLSMTDFTQTDLTQANLTATDLSEANLRGADLRGANLVRANLTKADLQQADLRGANLTRAKLSEVNLTNTDLTGANLALTDLTGAKFHLVE